MPDDAILEAFLRERVAQAVAPRTRFSIGEVKDDHFCLVHKGQEWLVGTGERGKLYVDGRFDRPTTAAGFLILRMLETSEGFTYPAVDWTGYASLPAAVTEVQNYR